MRRLFWDIETSPNIMFSWRAGYKINLPPENIITEREIICICWKWEGSKQVHSLQWDDGNDLEMIKAFAPVLLEADEMIAHNGDHFDLKWYQGRHLMHELPPIPASRTVDTLKIARKLFYLNSYRLEYLAQVLLGRGKIHTGFNLWRQCMEITQPDRDIRDKNVRKMVRYCKRDVSLVEDLWRLETAYTKPSTHAAVDATGNPQDRWKCSHCGSDEVVIQKTRTTAAGMVQHQMKCKSCHRYYSMANVCKQWYDAAKGR